MEAALEKLRELRDELDNIDEAHWTPRLFELAEEVDTLLRKAGK